MYVNDDFGIGERFLYLEKGSKWTKYFSTIDFDAGMMHFYENEKKQERPLKSILIKDCEFYDSVKLKKRPCTVKLCPRDLGGKRKTKIAPIYISTDELRSIDELKVEFEECGGSFEGLDRKEVEGGGIFSCICDSELFGERIDPIKRLEFIDVGDWTKKDVLEWLRQSRLYEDCEKAFRENDIDGSIVVELDEQTLLNIGIEESVLQTTMHEIERLRKNRKFSRTRFAVKTKFERFPGKNMSTEFQEMIDCLCDEGKLKHRFLNTADLQSHTIRKPKGGNHSSEPLEAFNEAKVKVKIVLKEKVVNNCNQRSVVTSNVVSMNSFVSPKSEFGNFVTALIVGPWYLEWNESELVIPKRMVSGRAIISSDVDTLNIPREGLNQISEKISEVVVAWNTKYRYSDTSNMKENRGNCQDFVDAVLSAIGVSEPFISSGGALDSFIRKIRSHGKVDDLEFMPSPDFRSFFGIKEESWSFKTHRELDMFCVKIREQCLDVYNTFSSEWSILKSFDRAFWLRHLKMCDDDRFTPLPPAERTLKTFNTGCPFDDPRNTKSYVGGGSCNVSNFRSTIAVGRLPSKDSIQFEGLFAEYFFNTGVTETDKTLDSFYYCAQAPSILSGEVEKYVGVSLHSSEDGKNHRDPLNLVVVLDISGSMGSSFLRNDSYNSTTTKRGRREVKMDVAKEVLIQIIGVMKEGERLGIVLFDNRTEILQPLLDVEMIDRKKLIDMVGEIRHRGGTNMEIGFREALTMMREIILKDGDDDDEESPTTNKKRSPKNHRIIFLTDAHPNAGGGPETLMGLTKKASQEHIYTSFIGIGLDFNTRLVDKIGKIRGSNYYSVNCEREFKKILNEDFNYLVTPLCFNTVLFFESEGLEIDTVYGTPHADESSGVLAKIDMMCAGPKSEELGVKGGMILLKLKEKLTPKLDPSMDIKITLRYEYPNTGERVQVTKEFNFEKKMEQLLERHRIFENEGIRKLVLLAKYGQIMKDTIEAAYQRQKNLDSDDSSSSSGKREYPALSEEMKRNLKEFKKFYKNEAKFLNDPSLEKELENIDKVMNIK